MSIIQHLFSGLDNATVDIGRVSWAASFVAVVGAAAANAWHGQTIDVQAFATALAVVVAAHGAVLWAKKDTEPKPAPPQAERAP